VEGDDKGRIYTCLTILDIARLDRKNRESRLTNSQEASCDKRLLVWALVISSGHAEKGELAPSVVRAREASERTCGSKERRFK
jgi:hypothetical protein